jgi:hypothetical protein
VRSNNLSGVDNFGGSQILSRRVPRNGFVGAPYPNGASLSSLLKGVEVDLVVDASVGWARVRGGVVAHAAFDGAGAGAAGSVGVEAGGQVVDEVIK